MLERRVPKYLFWVTLVDTLTGLSRVEITDKALLILISRSALTPQNLHLMFTVYLPLNCSEDHHVLDYFYHSRMSHSTQRHTAHARAAALIVPELRFSRWRHQVARVQ